MATPRTWLPRADEILTILRGMKTHQLDRPAVEELFQLQRRAANVVMRQAGASAERGKPFLIDRASLLAWTERVTGEERWHVERRQGTAEELSKSMVEAQAVRAEMTARGKPPVCFPIDESYFSANCASLPSGVRIEDGRITVDVSHLACEQRASTACQLLLQLAMAINNDVIGFEGSLSASKLTC